VYGCKKFSIFLSFTKYVLGERGKIPKSPYNHEKGALAETT
jgi:hypothetical protein